jgi:hypothetical protein
MLGTGIRNEYRARLESLETAVNDAAVSLKRMAAVVILAMVALVLLVAGK